MLTKESIPLNWDRPLKPVIRYVKLIEQEIELSANLPARRPPKRRKTCQQLNHLLGESERSGQETREIAGAKRKRPMKRGAGGLITIQGKPSENSVPPTVRAADCQAAPFALRRDNRDSGRGSCGHNGPVRVRVHSRSAPGDNIPAC